MISQEADMTTSNSGNDKSNTDETVPQEQSTSDAPTTDAPTTTSKEDTVATATKSEPTSDGKTDAGKGTRDNTVRTRQATDDERKPGAKVNVGQATTPMPEDGNGQASADGDGNGKTEPTADPEREKLEQEMAELQEKTKASGLSTKQQRRLTAIRTKLGLSAPTGGKAAAYDQAAAANPANAPKASATPRVSKWPEWTPPAVKRARYEYSGKNSKIAEGAHVPGASAGDHIAVRTRVEAMLAEEKLPVTPQNILNLTGLKTFKKLQAVACWQTPKEDMEPLRELGKQFKGNGWRVGRYLAAILCVWIEDLRVAEKEAKKAATAAKKADTAKAA